MSAIAALNPPQDLKLPIDGMTCASCVQRVEKALRALPGVDRAEVNLATEEATVRTSAPVQAVALAAAVREAGYDVPTRRVELQVEGMTCASCVARVEKALRKVPGVAGAAVNLATEKASVETLGEVSFATLAAAVGQAGYTAHPVEAAAVAPSRRLPDWWPVLAASVLTLPLVLPMLLRRPIRPVACGRGIGYIDPVGRSMPSLSPATGVRATPVHRVAMRRRRRAVAPAGT